MTPARPRAENARGFALIAVLWFLVLAAAIGTFIAAHGRSETAIARNIRAAATAEALADSGIAEAVFHRSDPADAKLWRLDGEPHLIALGGGQIELRLYDENAKINPNRASEFLLAALFQSLGVDSGRSRGLGAAIADWVGQETQPRRLGAKLAQYRAAGKDYGPPNAPLESFDELNLVLGMTPELLVRALPFLTLYTDDEEPRAAELSPIVRAALTLSRRLDPSGAQTAVDPDAPPVPSAGQRAGTQPRAPTDVFTADSTARSSDGGIFVRRAVVRLDAAKPKGYEILDWKRAILP